MSRPGRMLHLLVVIALCATTLLPVTATLAQSKRPANERWNYLFLVISDEDEDEFLLVRPFTSLAEDEAMDAEISRVKSLYDDGWEEMHIIQRISVYMNVLGSWGWEVVPMELPYEPLTQEVLVFKRQG